MEFGKRPGVSPESEARFEADRRKFKARRKQGGAAAEQHPIDEDYWRQDPARGWYPIKISMDNRAYQSADSLTNSPEYQASLSRGRAEYRRYQDDLRAILKRGRDKFQDNAETYWNPRRPDRSPK